jgi:hypothetical protein
MAAAAAKSDSALRWSRWSAEQPRSGVLVEDEDDRTADRRCNFCHDLDFVAVAWGNRHTGKDDLEDIHEEQRSAVGDHSQEQSELCDGNVREVDRTFNVMCEFTHFQDVRGVLLNFSRSGTWDSQKSLQNKRILSLYQGNKQ